MEKRARSWSFIGYPDDSLPENYREILSDEMHLCWCESPVHDADLNGDGSEKKKHIHFLVTFDGMKSFDQIKEITDRLHCPIPQKCRNVRSLVRYFIHLDNPDKYQYKKEEISCHGGFEIEDYFAKSAADYLEICKEIKEFIDLNDIKSFTDLVDIVYKSGDMDWISCITNRNTLFFHAYLRDKYYVSRDLERDYRG